MTRYTLTYFDFDGGRGEPIRIALHAAGIPFEDQRWTFQQFSESRDSVRFRCLPVLEMDGAAVTQSNALCRYVGKLANLYPEDALQALYCDEVLDSLEDINHYIVQTFGLEGEALRSAREKLVDGWLSTYVRGLGELLARGGDYFADGRLTVADLKMFVQTRSLCAGNLDHVPTDIVERLAPGLIEHQERIAREPVVVAYYASRN